MPSTQKLLQISFLVVILSITLDCFSQYPIFKEYKIYKNNRNYQVNTILQDNIGFIWFGTSEGLVKFDGLRYTFYGEKDSLAGKSVTCMTSDSTGSLWFGHKNGKISKFDGYKFTPFDPEAGLGEKEITSIFIDNKNNVWFSTLGEGVYVYNGKRLFMYSVDEGLSDNFVYCIRQAPDSKLWFGTDNGISVLDPGSLEFVTISMKDGLPDNIVKHIEFTSDSTAWVGMEDGGMARYLTHNKTFWQVPDWSFGTIHDFTVKDSKELWIATSRNGLIKINIQRENYFYTQFNRKNGLSSSSTFSVYNDDENNIWLGLKNGVNLYTGNEFLFLNEIHHVPFHNVYSITTELSKKLWLATDKGIFVASQKKDGQRFIQKIQDDKLKEEISFISLYTDKQQRIWAGTYSYGIFIIDPLTFEVKHLDKEDGLSDNNIIHITGNDSLISLSTLGGGVNIVNPHTFKIEHITDANGLSNNYIYSSFFDSKGNLWIAEDGDRICVYSQGKVEQYGKEDGLNGVIYGFSEDTAGNIWLNSSENGIFVYSNNIFYPKSDSLQLQLKSTATMTCIKDDLYVYGMDGLEKLNLSTGASKFYDEQYGTAWLEPHLNAICNNNDNAIYFGTSKGLVVYNIQNDVPDSLLPGLYLLRKKLFFNDIKNNETKFSYSQNHFSFEYSGFWYKGPDKLLYKHMLKGYDIDWSVPGKQTTVTYSNLPPGKYTFAVLISTDAKHWISNHDAEFSFSISPPFWKKTWFILLSILLVASAIVAFFRYRTAKLKRDKRLLEHEVQKRTEEIVAQKEHIEEQKKQIEEKNINITNSILYASRIQHALLPPEEHIKKHFTDYFILYKPRDIVSGDFYWIKEVGDTLYFAAADCTGHGVPGSLMSMLGISFLNEIANRKINNAGQVLDELRKMVMQSLRQTGKDGEAKDGMDISLGVLNKSNNRFHFAGAYNSSYIFRGEEVIKLTADRMPVGIYYKEVNNFLNREIQLQPGDVLYMFSDGFADQTGGENKRKYLSKRFKKLLSCIHHEPMPVQKDILESELADWQGNNDQVDDVLVVGIKIS